MNFAQVTKPASGVIMPEGYVRAMAQLAYIWGWPLVNMVNRRAAITQPPCPAWSAASCRSRRADGSPCCRTTSRHRRPLRHLPNEDVVYGLGFFSLDVEPVVIQVTDFGDRFWVYASI
ncbi:MAG TPA: DUF1254 domain-containing protein [Roseiarcus sp.]|jgi:hypothetical protein